MASKALQAPKESQFRALWYVTSSIAFFLSPALCCSQLEPVSEMGQSCDLCIYITLTNSSTAAQGEMTITGFYADEALHFIILAKACFCPDSP